VRSLTVLVDTENAGMLAETHVTINSMQKAHQNENSVYLPNILYFPLF
jgi:hypothetical protein